MTSPDERQDQPITITIAQVIAQVQERDTETLDYDVEDGVARLAARIAREGRQPTTGQETSPRRAWPGGPVWTSGLAEPAPSTERAPRRAKPKQGSRQNSRLRSRVPAYAAPRTAVPHSAETAGPRFSKAAATALASHSAPVPRESVQLDVLGLHLKVRGRRMMTRIAATLGQVVVSVVALLHDARLAILVVGGLTGLFVLGVTVATGVAVLTGNDKRRSSAHWVLRVLLDREGPGHAVEPGDTYINVQGKGTAISVSE